MTKYDWSGVPDYIKYAATDVLGRYLGFIEKPKNIDEHCVMHCDYFLSTHFHDATNWQNSLEERPHDNSN